MFARSMRAKWDKSKLASKSDVQIIEEMIGNFKQAFESQNQNALEKMSELQSNRKGFISPIDQKLSIIQGESFKCQDHW